MHFICLPQYKDSGHETSQGGSDFHIIQYMAPQFLHDSCKTYGAFTKQCLSKWAEMSQPMQTLD
jgi:hypothetical protein